MKLKIICCFSLVSLSLHGMESGDFKTYLATPEVEKEMETFTDFLQKEKKIDESKWEGYKAVALVGMKVGYKQLQSLRKNELVIQEANSLLLKPKGYHSFVSAILKKTLRPRLDDVSTLKDWDSCFVFGVGIVCSIHNIQTNAGDTQKESLNLIEQFSNAHPDRVELCNFLQGFLGDGCLLSSDPCFDEQASATL